VNDPGQTGAYEFIFSLSGIFTRKLKEVRSPAHTLTLVAKGFIGNHSKRRICCMPTGVDCP
jgi:hypothetical protein